MAGTILATLRSGGQTFVGLWALSGGQIECLPLLALLCVCVLWRGALVPGCMLAASASGSGSACPARLPPHCAAGRPSDHPLHCCARHAGGQGRQDLPDQAVTNMPTTCRRLARSRCRSRPRPCVHLGCVICAEKLAHAGWRWLPQPPSSCACTAASLAPRPHAAATDPAGRWRPAPAGAAAAHIRRVSIAAAGVRAAARPEAVLRARRHAIGAAHALQPLLPLPAAPLQSLLPCRRCNFPFPPLFALALRSWTLARARACPRPPATCCGVGARWAALRARLWLVGARACLWVASATHGRVCNASRSVAALLGGCENRSAGR